MSTGWYRSAIHKVGRWREMSGWQRWLFVRSWLALPAIDLSLRLLGFRATRALTAGLRFLRLRGVDNDGVADVWRAVDAAARHHLWEMRCLSRSIALMHLASGVGGLELKIGVKRSEADLEAHAWVELEGQPVGEHPDVLCHFHPLAGV